MRAHAVYWFERLRASLWFLPIAGVLLAVGLSWITITLDKMGLGHWLRTYFGLYNIDPAGARLILSTIAGSMMTIASLVFSMTVLTLTVASQQMGPRLLEWFMSDQINQVLMSYFVSLFVFALLGIGAIDDGSINPGDRNSAYLTVILAILLTIFGIIALIIFVHRTATSIQTDNAIARTARNLNKAIQAYLTDEDDGRPVPSMPAVQSKEQAIESARDGYLQTIDEAALLELAARLEGRLRLRCAVGQFVISGTILADFEGDRLGDDDMAAIRQKIVLGPKRTATRDVIFNLRGVVEIGLRALSPGINDPFTAVACIDHLAAALAIVMRRRIRDAVVTDRTGEPRLLTIQPGFGDMVDAAFDEIRAFGRDHAPVLRRQIEAIRALSRFAARAEQRDILNRHISRLRHTIEQGSIQPALVSDLLDLLARTEQEIQSLQHL